MNPVAEILNTFKAGIPDGVRLVAVSKTKPATSILEAYEAGQRVFGENRVGELIAKNPALPSDIEWHFIGHLQTNKVRQVVRMADVIESVDSLKLLLEIIKQSAKAERQIQCYLQFHIASEETKYGLDMAEARELLGTVLSGNLGNVVIAGVMGMATFTDDMDTVRREFRQLKDIFESIRFEYFPTDERFREISMGMSGDYRIAIEEGSTNIRIGSALFGEREKH